MNKDKIKKLDSLYSILDLMENEIISSFYKKELKKDIKNLLLELMEELK